MRIGLEKERSERVSHSSSQVHPCGLMRRKMGYMATSSVCLIPVVPKAEASKKRGGRGSAMTFSLRKEVIQPQVLLRLPCYDFTPIMNHTLDGCPLAVGSPASSAVHFRDVTGGVYKARERIHRGVLIRDY